MAAVLAPDEGLNVGDSLPSPKGQFRLTLQPDGNLVVYQEPEHRPVWAAGTLGQQVTHAIMQPDGNFVVYGPGGPVWATGTGGNPGAFLVVQDDGNLVLYAPARPLWSALK